MAGLVEQLDAKIADLLAGWNLYSTVLVAAIAVFVAWVVYDTQDADTHPLLLARQSQASYVRQPGESAIYRSPETPHGYPLRSGLNVKSAGAPLYTPGRDGDLRDIWRRVTGEIPLEKDPGSSSKIITVYGKEHIVEHDIADITREISIIGTYFKEHGAKRVAIYLPNSIEFLSALFAGAFYGFSPILIPYNQPQYALIELLRQTKADSLIAAAGSVPLAEVSEAVPGIRHVIWTVEEASRNLDWNDVPEGIGGKVDVSVWHDLVQDQKNRTAKLPEDGAKPANIVFVWQEKPGAHAEIVEFTQGNIAAASGALISALPAPQRLTKSDTFLPADIFTNSYCLCLTLGALFSHSTLVVNSVAGPGVDLTLASRAVSPTVIVVSAETAAKLHNDTTTTITGGLKKLAHYLESRVLTSGRMPTDTFLSRLNAPKRAAIGATPGKLRLLFISERAGQNTPPLSSDDLSDLRVYTNARVVYALSAAKVAGAVTQTNVYDYRRGIMPANKHSHFGAPLSCVEVKLKDTSSHKTTDEQTVGEVYVNGPSVAGGEASLGFNGTFREDHTLAYV